MKVVKFLGVNAVITVVRTQFQSENGQIIQGFGVNIYLQGTPNIKEKLTVKMKLKIDGKTYFKTKSFEGENLTKILNEKAIYLFVSEKEFVESFEIEFI